MHKLGVSCFVAFLALLPLFAEAVREFPANARRGALEAHEYPHYRIDKTTYRLAAGGRIFDQQNLIMMPMSLQQQKAEVMYKIDINGQLSAIWLLTPAEAEKFPRRQAPKPASPGKP